MIYTLDEKLERMGEKVRNACHKKRLQGSTILYLLCDKPIISGGKERSGKAQRPGALLRFACSKAFEMDPDFIVTVVEPWWEGASDAERQALLDHELTHCEVKLMKDGGTPRLCIRGHDVEEFDEVLRRRGAWHGGLRQIQATMAQLPIPFEKPASEGGASDEAAAV